MSKVVAVAVVAVTLSACASTGATFRSGVADTFLAHAPYVAGVRPTLDARIVRLPVSYQRGGSQSAMFDPAANAGTPVASLLAEMNAWLDGFEQPAALDGTIAGTPPDVHFGCEVDIGGDCTNGPAARFDWGKPRMRLAVGRPSADWIAALAPRLDSAGATHALLITLEVGQYWPQQTNWRGSKALELGRNHSMDLPWLSSLETPVSVLQLTGVLIGRDGLATRIAAEGLIARRTGIIAAGLGAQALITDEDVEKVRTARRADLPGNPLVWQTALRNLVADLTGAELPES